MSIAMQCLALLSGDAAVQAQLNGTSPWEVVRPGWAPQPAGRGTMDIIWSCLVTIFACCWTVRHPSFPRKGDKFSSKVVLCIVAVVAPEWLADQAFNEYMPTRHYLKIINKMNRGQWTMSQSFFVGMGGVELEFKDCTETLGCDEHGFFESDNDGLVTLSVLQQAIQLKILDIKSISIEDVKKRAKTNYLVKALVCLQASWLVAQVIGRAIAKLPITTLEVVTIGYVACALITYSCWWHKPQDSEAPITVNCRRLTKASFHQQIKALQKNSFADRRWETALFCVVAGTFGAVHCTAWNFFFPTSVEGVIWRVSSVLTVVLPSIMTPSGIYFTQMPDWISNLNRALLFVYIPVRLYLMAELFVAFRSVPVGIFYTVNWSTWIPHV
jgi:hypothetical protein